MRSQQDLAFQRPAPVWQKARGIDAVIERWQSDPKVASNLTFSHAIEPVDARFADFPEGLASAVTGALRGRGIDRLYSHQHEAISLARAGKDVVVATPTASGKSLCYHLPVLDCLAREQQARALYLFPTKALARDQEESLGTLMREIGLSQGVVTYDGDTPQDARRAARNRTGVVITNPDMLHTGILPHHPSWARLWANLRYVVIDELHSYRGVFGSHLANVLRRLDRVARFHQASPTYLFASATIGNPQEHAARMIGRPVELVGTNGAPRGKRHLLVYNPPVVNRELGIRESYIKAATRLTAELVRAGVSTLLFGQSRNTVEVMLKYLREALAADRIDSSLIHAYRGGYLPTKRREIEARLRRGEIQCVVATNALELGIDIGALDAVVCAGYPGSLASLWQRFGRAGRRQEASLALLVSSSAPLDQYVAGSPQLLIDSQVEQARIDPDNVEILVQHLKCSAFELPFERGEGFRDLAAQNTVEALEYLASHQTLHPVDHDGRTMFHWASEAYPANHVSLRTLSWDNFAIIDLDTDRTIAEMDWRSTHTMLHEQAIYQHEAEQYQVERLDYENHKAYVRKVEPDYFTTAMTQVKVEVLSETAAAQRPNVHGEPLRLGHGEISVTEKVVGYKKIKFHTHENIGYGEVHLPVMQKHTTSMWLTVPESVVRSMSAPRPAVIDALRGLGQAMHTVACVGLMIDPRDLARTLESGARSESRHQGADAFFEPTLFLYDNVPGGVGLASRLFERRDELLERTRTLIDGCQCDDGCPACIGPAIGSADDLRRRPLVQSLLSALSILSLQ